MDEVASIAPTTPRAGCLRRVGRRGLISAVIEGALVANEKVVAVIDALIQPRFVLFSMSAGWTGSSI